MELSIMRFDRSSKAEIKYKYILYLNDEDDGQWQLPRNIANFLFMDEEQLKKMALEHGLQIRNKYNVDVEIWTFEAQKMENFIKLLDPWVLAAKMVVKT